MKLKGGNEEEKDISSLNLNYSQLANIIMIFFLFFSLLINILLILIHSKQKSLRKGFFAIIFIQIILEAIITLSLLVMNILFLIDIYKYIWFIILPIIFNFGYVTNILYNIRIIFYLLTLNKNKYESVNYGLKEDDNEEDNDSKKTKKSVQFVSHSYNSFHLFCFLLSIIHSILYGLWIFLYNRPEDDENWKWFYYFIYGSKCFIRFIFFIFHYIFFLISIPYLILSINKAKISDHILLKRFSIYCIFSSIIGLFFPISIFFQETDKDMEKIPFIILSAFIVYLYITWYFRINCYYIQYILEQNGKGFCKKCISGIKILFCCHNVPTPNFIDYNSSFIYHSLANLNDFLQELTIDKKANNEAIANEDIKDSVEISAGI